MKTKVVSDFLLLTRQSFLWLQWDGLGSQIKKWHNGKIVSNKLIGKCTQWRRTFSTLQKVSFDFRPNLLWHLTGICHQHVNFPFMFKLFIYLLSSSFSIVFVTNSSRILWMKGAKENLHWIVERSNFLLIALPLGKCRMAKVTSQHWFMEKLSVLLICN